MKSIMQSLIIAFSMYSKIPMPRSNWEEKNLRYAMCFFPFVGAVIGAIMYLFFYIANEISLSKMITTGILVVIPILITGGIHMDGFLDTVDALSSNQSKENKLRILSDPHAGAFAIIYCVVYFLLTFCFWYEISINSILIISIGFILSRSLSALSVVNFKKAKTSGLAHTFSNSAIRRTVSISNLLILILCSISMLVINPILGSIALVGVFLSFIFYRYIAYKNFGGITGDLCGYFLQIGELVMLIVVVGGDMLWFL